MREPLLLVWENISICPISHYNLEMADVVRQAVEVVGADCIAVELPENRAPLFIRAASRLPDISLVKINRETPIYYMCEPADPIFEALRSGIERGASCYCIDLDVEKYPDVYDPMPDPYAITRIGHSAYVKAYFDLGNDVEVEADRKREMYMARRLKELSYRHEKILFVCGASHARRVEKYLKLESYPEFEHEGEDEGVLVTLTEESAREVMAECAYFTMEYEAAREEGEEVDRQKWLYQLFKEAGELYREATGNSFPGYHMRNLMKYARNYALMTGRLIPDLYQILSVAKGCVDHNYAYAVWELATEYPYRRNLDGLPEEDLKPEDVWGREKKILFHLKQKSRKSFLQRKKNKGEEHHFRPTGGFSICSHPPEDLVIESFGDFLKKKGKQVLQNESGKSVEFRGSLEDGIDLRETIRNWHEGKLYVKVGGKPRGEVGSVVVIFDPDNAEEAKQRANGHRNGNGEFREKYPWKTTWLGEHDQESDMSFYATRLGQNVVGPGISRCEYGGFMMSYPPRRMFDVWSDPDYSECPTKAETLLIAAIDYAVEPLVVYVAPSPPRSFVKSYARRFNKKVVYIPIGQISPIMVNRIRAFHVLDGHDKREIAGDYIF